jgi:hypothetical protein
MLRFIVALTNMDIQGNLEVTGNINLGGNLTIGEPDYDVWGASGDINLAAYQWAATELNITLA